MDHVSSNRRKTMVRLHKAEVMIAGEQLRYGVKEEEKSVWQFCITLCIYILPISEYDLPRTTQVFSSFWWPRCPGWWLKSLLTVFPIQGWGSTMASSLRNGGTICARTPTALWPKSSQTGLWLTRRHRIVPQQSVSCSILWTMTLFTMVSRKHPGDSRLKVTLIGNSL